MNLGSRTLALALALPLALTACGDGGGDPPAPGQEVRSDKARDTAPNVSAEDRAALVGGATDFALRLHQQLASQPGNLIYSPLSVSTALAMLYAGARGDTESQMAEALGYTLPQDRLHPAMNWLDLELSSRADADPGEGGGQPFTLRIVNHLWGQTGFSFLPAFLDTLAVSYDAGLSLFDFTKEAAAARVAINDWVAAQTHDRIKDLLPEGLPTPDTRLVLTNAVYFYASWMHPFEHSATHDAPFHLDGGSDVSVPTMHKVDDDGAFAAGDGYVVAEMPYVGGQVAMTLVVPDAGRFDEIEASLTAERLDAMIADLHPSALDIAMPSFQFELGLSLPQALAALGMVDAFGPKSDLSGIDGARDLFVQAIIHKAFIKVDEDGTEAAAATAVVVGDTAEPIRDTVNVDRPFLFFLRDRGTGAILFVGRVTNPAAE
jgi:serpin B